MKKKKICFVLPHFHLEYSGGAETQCYFLAKELIARNWEVHYIRESNTTETTIQEGIFVHGLPKQKSYKKWANNSALLALMEEIKADYWYTRANISYLYWLNKYAPKTSGKVVWAFSRDSQLQYNGEIERYPSIFLKGFHLMNKAVFLNSLKKTDIILVQTKYQGNLLKEKFKLEGTHIYNAHPIDSEETNLNRNQQIVWVGRMQNFKHPERFLELAEYCQDLPLDFLMIGPLQNQQMKKMILEKAEALPNVTLLGKQPPSEVKKILKKSLFLVNTSDYEGFSNTFIEAWIQGLPVLSFHVDPDEIIQTFGLGWISNDLAQIKNIIIPFSKDQKIRGEYANRCKEFVASNFDIHKAVDKLETVIN